MIEKHDLLRVHEWQEVSIQIRNWLLTALIVDAVNVKSLPRPESSIAVTYDRADAVSLEKGSEFTDDTLRTERRNGDSDRIQDGAVTLAMGNRESCCPLILHSDRRRLRSRRQTSAATQKRPM
jgi:hypothetical protein